MGYGDFSAIPHGRYEYEKEYVLLDLVFIWLKEHSLIVLLLLGTSSGCTGCGGNSK